MEQRNTLSPWTGYPHGCHYMTARSCPTFILEILMPWGKGSTSVSTIHNENTTETDVFGSPVIQTPYAPGYWISNHSRFTHHSGCAATKIFPTSMFFGICKRGE